MTVITIVIDEDDDEPRIHLDNCPPSLASLVFRKASEALEAYMPYPTISYNGEKIVEGMYAPITFEFDYEDDEEDED